MKTSKLKNLSQQAIQKLLTYAKQLGFSKGDPAVCTVAASIRELQESYAYGILFGENPSLKDFVREVRWKMRQLRLLNLEFY